MALPSIVGAKLVGPDVVAPGAVPPRALDRLTKDLEDGGVAIVAAPSGFGRRQLVAAWVRTQPPQTTTWIRVDSADEPVRLFVHVAAALAQLDPPVTFDVESVAAAGERAIVEHGVAELLAAVSRDPRRLTLVVDGFHRAPADSRAGLLAAVRYRPANGGLVFITRDDDVLSPWPGGIDERPTPIGMGLLRIGTPEVTALAESLGVEVTVDQAAALVRDTDGWLAGIELTLRATAQDGRPPVFDVGQSEISAYLHQNVCLWMDPELRSFYGDVAVAGPLDADLCEEVTGRADAGRLLRRLLALHLVDHVDGAIRTPELIRAHLEADRMLLDRRGLSRARRAAAQCHAAAGRIDDALALLERAPTDEGMQNLLLERHQAWSAGPHAPRIAALAAAGLGAAPGRHELYLVKAWAESFAGLDRAAVATLSLVTSLPATSERSAFIRGEVAAIRSNLHRRAGRLDDALAEATTAATAAADADAAAMAPYRGALPDSAALWLGVAQFYAGALEECRATLLAATAGTHWTPIALGAIHGTLALAAWVLDDPVAPIHGAIAASHLDQRASQGDFLGAASMALVGSGPDAEAAAEWTALAASIVDAPVAHVLAAAVEAVRTEHPEVATRALARARTAVARCPQPGVLSAIVARAGALTSVEEAAPGLGDALSDGERRVIRALAGNLTEREIAAELHLSHNTVRTYRRRAYRKLGVSSRAEAIEALEALEGGDVD